MSELARNDNARSRSDTVLEDLSPFAEAAIHGLSIPDEDAEALARALNACAVAEIDRRALLLRFTHVPPALLRPAHRQRARAALEPLLFADRARRFRLADGSLVVLWRGPASERLDQALRSLLLLFADLPHGVVQRAEVICQLELPRDNAVLFNAIEESRAALQPRRSAVRAMPEQPLDIATLASLEQALAQADVAHFARRKPVCSLGSDSALRLQWEKRYLSISEIAAVLAPEHNPLADPWLFRRLTRTLDRRMLALLSHPEELRLAGPFALDMNVASILSPYFLRFDAALPQSLRGEVLLELLPTDMLADPATFIFARDFARARGYKILLRDVVAEMLPVLPLDCLGMDYVQLRWSAELEAMEPTDITQAAELDRIVLSRIEGRDALDWGVRAGIGLFMGSHIYSGLRIDAHRPWVVSELPPEPESVASEAEGAER
jgi:hypothetical protein